MSAIVLLIAAVAGLSTFGINAPSSPDSIGFQSMDDPVLDSLVVVTVGSVRLTREVAQLGFDSVYAAADSSGGFRKATDYFHLKMNSPEIFKLMSGEKEGSVSEPVRGPDGYYIFRIDETSLSPITTDYEKTNLSQQLENEIKQHEADIASDAYVEELMKSVQPVIKRNAFNLLCGNIASEYLPRDKFDDWHLSRLLMSEAGPIRGDQVRNHSSVPLIDFNGGNVNLGEFFEWYNLRSANFNIAADTRNKIMSIVESYVRRMLRDKLLVKQTVKEGLNRSETYKSQMKKWNAKLSYLSLQRHLSGLMRTDSESVVRYFLENYPDYGKSGDTTLDLGEKYDGAKRDYVEFMTRSSLLHTIGFARQYVKVEENYPVVDRLALPPQSGHNPVEVLFFKTGRTFPRKAFPTIDDVWQKIIP